MKRSITLLPVVVIALTVTLFSCDKKEAFQSAELTEFINPQPGKFIRYRLDSLLFINFGEKDTIVSYQAKDVVDAAITDNLGRPAWRVIRYLRDLNSTNEGDWKVGMAYQVLVTRETIEVTEDNLRYRKLKLPVVEGYNWLGNSLLPLHPFQARYQFSNDGDMQSWPYTYENVNAPATVNGKPYDNTITVFQAGDSVNIPVRVPNSIGYRDHWVEQYAKNIGLIYKEVVMYEYQPPNGTKPAYRTGFGIKLSIIDHN